MKANLRQIYPIHFSSQKKNCIYQFEGENLFTNLFFKFEQNLHKIKFDAIAAIAHLNQVANLVQIYFPVLYIVVEIVRCYRCFTLGDTHPKIKKFTHKCPYRDDDHLSNFKIFCAVCVIILRFVLTIYNSYSTLNRRHHI